MNNNSPSPPPPKDAPREEPLSKTPLPKTRKFNQCSVLLLLLLLVVLPIAFSRYIQHSTGLEDALIPEEIAINNTASSSSKSEIKKSVSDQNEYRYITLPNGLKVFMISHPTAQMSCAALILDVGSFSEPPEVPGLAHLLEHILVLGSKTYSKEIYEAQVYGEASISRSDTVFHYGTFSAKFEKSLDIFADPFINPRFDFEWYEPELSRIDKEFNETVMKDAVLRYIVDQGSLAARDRTGNYETLHRLPIKQGINISQALHDLFEKYYSPNLMSLVVLHNKPLDEIQKIVANSTFSRIPNKNVSKPSLDHFPRAISDENRNKILNYSLTLPEKDKYDSRTEGSMAFQICGMQSKMNIMDFLIDILNRDHSGSLVSEVIRTNWASAIRLSYFEITSEYGLLLIDFDLTFIGRYHFEDLVQTVFGYIHKLIHEGLTKALYQEYYDKKNYLFQNSRPFETSRKLADLARGLLRYSPEDVLSKFGLSDDVPEILAQAKSMLQQMNTHNLLLLQSLDRKSSDYEFLNLINDEHQKSRDQNFEKLKTFDPITKIDYLVETIPQDLIQKWNATSGENYPAFKFFQQNPFIPKNFGLIKEEHQVDMISNNIWHVTANDLKTPKVALFVEYPNLKSIESQGFLKLLQNSFSFESPNAIHVDDLVKEQIRNAGSSVEIQDQSIKIKAWSDNLPLILDAMPQIETNCSRSLNETKSLKSRLELLFFKFPHEEGLNLLSEIMINYRCTSYQEIKENIWDSFLNLSQNPDKCLKMANNLFANAEFIVYGNILPKDAKEMVKKLAAKAPQTTIPILPQNPLNISRHNLIYRTNFLAFHKNSAFVLNYYQGGVANKKNLAYLKILVFDLKEYMKSYELELFKLQAMVSLESYVREGTVGFFITGFSFASSRFDQNKLDRLIEEIITDFLSKVKKSPLKKLEMRVREISASIPKSLQSHSFERRADAISKLIYTREENSDYLQKTTAKEYLDFMNDYFAHCGKISLQGFGKGENFTNYTAVLPEKRQLIMKKQPVLINSTGELKALFASQIAVANKLRDFKFVDNVISVISYFYRIFTFLILGRNPY